LGIAYPTQLYRKGEAVKELFAEFPGVVIHPVLPSPKSEGYRHKVQLPFGSYREGRGRKLTLGCYAENSHQVVDQTECRIQDPGLTAVAYAVRAWAQREQIPPYFEREGTGFLRHVLLRRGAATGEILLGLVTNGPKPPGSRNLAKGLLERCERALRDDPGQGHVVGIVQDVNTRDTNVVLGGHEEIWWGRDWLKEKLGDIVFHVGLSTFFQVNPFQTPRLYDIVASLLPEGCKCLDAYSGMGTIALWISKRCREVVAVEENHAAVRAARLTAQHQGAKNVRVLQGDTAEVLPGLVQEGFDAAVVDPPRKGMDENSLNAILDAGVKRLVYVSCNPETLARDAKLLAPKLRLRAVHPVDMFPHTFHVECVALFTRD